MPTGTAAGSVRAADLRSWAIVYDPQERRMYEVLEVVEGGAIAVLLDANEDYDPRAVREDLPLRRVEVRWAEAHLRLVREAPDYSALPAARLPDVAGSFRR